MKRMLLLIIVSLMLSCQKVPSSVLIDFDLSGKWAIKGSEFFNWDLKIGKKNSFWIDTSGHELAMVNYHPPKLYSTLRWSNGSRYFSVQVVMLILREKGKKYIAIRYQ